LQALVAKSNARGYIRKTANPLSFVDQVDRFLLDSPRGRA
jgi:hypothetical protein